MTEPIDDGSEAVADMFDALPEEDTADGDGSVTILPPDPDDPALKDVLNRARHMHPPEHPLAPDVPLVGAHILTPDWHGGADEPPPREAAVLLALGRSATGELSVILTERAAHLSAHAGQVALPGGKLEAGETPSQAALREAQEEVHLPPSAVSPIGVAEGYLTRTGFIVIPVLGLIKSPAVLRPDPSEVADIFIAPWQRVMDAAHRRELSHHFEGRPRRFYEIMVGDKRVWGVTAGIFKHVSDRLYVR